MFSSEQSYSGLGDSKLKRQQSFKSTIGWMVLLFRSSSSESGIISDGRTDEHNDSQRENIISHQYSVSGYKKFAF